MRAEVVAGFYKALGDPVRIRILSFLLSKDDCVCICRLSSHLERDQSVVFRHVQILRDAGLVDCHKEGSFLMCCINDKKTARRLLEVSR